MTGVVLLAGCCVASWSRTQTSYVLSSCESELYALGSAAVEMLGVHAFLVEQGLSKEPPVVWETVRRLCSWHIVRERVVKGSETVSDTVMVLNGTLAIAESAQCR